MRVVITGGFGFLGRQVTGTLLKARTFLGVPIDRLVLVDRVVPSEPPSAFDPLVEIVRGDLMDHLGEVFAQPVDVLIHLAAAVSAECEADFDLGMGANLDTTRALLEAARAQSAAAWADAAPGVLQQRGGLWSRPGAPTAVCRQRGDPAHATIELRDPETRLRATDRGLHPTRFRRRTRRSPGDRDSAARQAERRRLRLPVRHHP